jgi:hypothetical protein
MNLQIALLSAADDEEYEARLSNCPGSMLYYSISYRNFLQRLLENSSGLYIAAYESNRLAAVLPTVIKRNPILGNVVNALPFFGSHGGILVFSGSAAPESIKHELIEAFEFLCRKHDVVASTLIENPLVDDRAFYKQHFQSNYSDERIGQITPLPQRQDSKIDIQEALFRQFHHKTRNSIRKAQQSELIVTHDASLDALEAIAKLHRDNMQAIGGTFKPWEIFLAIRSCFNYDSDYRVYVARRDGRIIAALLVFFFYGTAEYFIPATDPEYRILQPMSLLVFEAMQEAAKRGLRNWNWGGTWATQSGVYHFKKRWGTRDFPYTYHVNIRNDRVLQCSPSELLTEYPYFYVAPFEQLLPASHAKLV